MMPQWKDVTQRATGLALSATGKRVAVEARGEIFTIPAEKGDVRNLTNSSASAEIAPVWSPDGKSIAYFSDRSGEYQLVIAPQEGVGAVREIALPEPSRPYSPAWSPDGKTIAFQDTHFRIWLVDVASGKAKIADADPYFMMDRSIVPVWSPDSRYVAYPKRLKSLLRAIFVYEVANGTISQLTDGMADATSPVWDASGKYLWFLASTNFALNSSLLDMSKYDRPETKALYLAVLTRTDPSPLLPESDDEAGRNTEGVVLVTARAVQRGRILRARQQRRVRSASILMASLNAFLPCRESRNAITTCCRRVLPAPCSSSNRHR